MSSPIATQILSFENFGALENHLRSLKNRYNDLIKKYEETLGFILRDTKPTSAKSQKVQEKWALEMQRAMAATTTAAAAAAKSAKGTPLAKKEESKPKLLFGNGKDKEKDKERLGDDSGEWIPLDPMSLFIGKKNRGLAEIYFDTINILRENVSKINTALSVCSALKAKAATAGSTSLVVSFVNDIPTKVMLKPLRDDGSKKYTMAFSFAVPSMPPAAKSHIIQ
ncbi:hypothetical protein Ngar_c29320 [Candidatus Nitrososphaera gargensis Ga9.2]|uniref:Uncharacterized protein n=1 Tax=Nitrososphaera gargensis (strain Ga9.2) TaxID=1237085 RepID=K0IIS1_NITGG|nr:hypothetical protein [Candidatus Nitrososphaera gargensis]AFU59850.1 hypothetical protein Ngar_c29320 [Candidatus Nitrososphaera gargensis Ga9.2]